MNTVTWECSPPEGVTRVTTCVMGTGAALPVHFPSTERGHKRSRSKKIVAHVPHLVIRYVPGFKPQRGVFNSGTEAIEVGTVVGIYFGTLVSGCPPNDDYFMDLSTVNNLPWVFGIDASKNRGDMAYINGVTKPDMANVVFEIPPINTGDEFRYTIYVKTCETILPGHQLRVYYGPNHPIPSDALALITM